jgi:cation transport ATPase
MTTTDSVSALQALLHRPIEQRIREYQYRAAQSTVFGLPVLALHFFGPHLGAGADRWPAIMQMLLTGWIVYVGAAGMIVEGLLTLRAKYAVDFLVAMLASVLFAVSSARVIYHIASAASVAAATYFHLTVLLLAIWTMLRFAWLSRRQPM